MDQLGSGATSAVAAFDSLFTSRTSRWLPCRSGRDRKEPGHPAGEPRKGAVPQVKRNQCNDNPRCTVSLPPHAVAKAQIDKKRFENPLEQIFTVKSITVVRFIS